MVGRGVGADEQPRADSRLLSPSASSRSTSTSRAVRPPRAGPRPARRAAAAPGPGRSARPGRGPRRQVARARAGSVALHGRAWAASVSATCTTEPIRRSIASAAAKCRSAASVAEQRVDRAEVAVGAAEHRDELAADEVHARRSGQERPQHGAASRSPSASAPSVRNASSIGHCASVVSRGEVAVEQVPQRPPDALGDAQLGVEREQPGHPAAGERLAAGEVSAARRPAAPSPGGS